ncbi:hypothetical protein CFC21_081209 [Triticum aestivum]|uniref:Neprosin PEP catalytic domain-containing protein n=2 Tax=Triticum aestivum TaxID=4565 RepID=A0A9R1I3U5_WHEAT|nr:uncharacterized protein LOC123126295 [Triticum aestivum]KAF7076579.1 hypothetical protein CFC21_081209 [Triticum aestivum]
MAATRACLVALAMALTFLFLEGPAVVLVAPAATTDSLVQRRRDVQRLLRRLNKPPVASILSPDGDVIDCVHISKQPAFDHPLLKNHTIQMRPSYNPGGIYHDSNIAPHPITQTWHQNGKCPENTIPIQRTKEEDVHRASSIKRYGKKRPRSIPNLSSINDPEATNITRGHRHAVASTSVYKFHGTKATFNLWQPMIARANDFSLAQLWISGGSYSGNDLNTIEVGWQVYPQMYNDNNTRIFIYWTRDAYQTTGCYNLKCSGFIQTNNQITLDGSISPVSNYGGTQHDLDISVWKDPKGGNWWLQVGTNYVGYWPSSIFSYLANNASSVQWGGEVWSPDAGQTSTQMGSGHFPEEGFGKASYIKNIHVVDSFDNLEPLSDVQVIATQKNCYNAENGFSSDMGTYIYYGGAGKNSNCP